MELSKERRQCNDGHVMIVAGGADREIWLSMTRPSMIEERTPTFPLAKG